MSQRQIAAVVVTFESASTIDECLRRLRQARDIAEIRVVDNGSGDGTLALVQRHALSDSRVHFIANPDNPGFAAACNQGAADSRSPWLVFINPDLMIQTDTLEQLGAHAEILGEAILGVEQVDEHGHADPAVRRRDPNFAMMLRSPRRAAELAVAAVPGLAVQCVDAISGALMLMPRTLFTRIGGWDAGYRLHAEDLDLCRRARLAGATVAVANNLRVVHLRGVSSRARPFFVEWHKHRGLWRYFRKFEAASRGLPVRVAIALAIWVHALAQLPRLLRRTR